MPDCFLRRKHRATPRAEGVPSRRCVRTARRVRSAPRYSSGGKLYATFDAVQINPSPFTITPVIDPALYQIDPTTGVANLIGATALTLGSATEVNGTAYAFQNMRSEVLALDAGSGNTVLFNDFDPAAGLIDGASPTPEPLRWRSGR